MILGFRLQYSEFTCVSSSGHVAAADSNHEVKQCTEHAQSGA